MSPSPQDYRKNLLGNDLFLTQFATQLRTLREDADFMQLITDIFSQAQSERMGIQGENNLAKKVFYEQQAYFKFPSYKQIADKVVDQGYAKNSAAISTYCVMRMFQEGAELEAVMGTAGEALSPKAPEVDYIPSDDEDAERWNEICFLVNRYRTPNASERDFQIEAENILEKLGWSRYRGEIETQVAIPVGSTRNVYADIVLYKNGTNVMVIELKKPNAGISARNVDQLFSYMRMLKLNYGLLIGDTIKLFYDDPTDREVPVQVVEVPFIANSADGVEFCRVISFDSFSDSTMEKFIGMLISRASIEEQTKELLELIVSPEGSTLTRQALFQFFCEKYPPDVVNKVLDEIKVSVKIEPPKRGEVHQPVASDSTSEVSHDDEFADMKVGRLADTVLRSMLEKGAASEGEISKMQGASYSKTAFDLNYPLLVPADGTYQRRRYYAESLWINGREYKLCSQWFEGPSNNDRPYLVKWIRDHK